MFDKQTKTKDRHGEGGEQGGGGHDRKSGRYDDNCDLCGGLPQKTYGKEIIIVNVKIRRSSGGQEVFCMQ